MIDEISYSQTEVVARLQARSDIRGYQIIPTLLDGAFHSLAAGLLKSNDENLFLPVAIDALQCHAAIDGEVWCHAVWKKDEGDVRSADLTIAREDGTVLLQIKGLTVQQVRLAALRKIHGNNESSDQLVYELVWQPGRLQGNLAKDRRWLIVHSGKNETLDRLALELVNRLQSQGHTATSVSTDGQQYQETEIGCRLDGRPSDSWHQVLTPLEESNFHGICWIVDSQSFESARQECERILTFVQSLLQLGKRQLECGLNFVTTNAIAINLDDKTVNPEATQFWGLGRVLGQKNLN